MIGQRRQALSSDAERRRGDSERRPAETLADAPLAHPEPAEPRQASVLALHPRIGNAAVANMLCRTPEPAPTPAPTAPTKSPAEALKEAADSLTETGGTGSAADKQAIIDELVKIPLVALTTLKTKGVKVVVCRNSVTEILEDLKGVKPDGWPAGKTWDTVPGLYEPGAKRVIIATRGGKMPATGDGHGASNLVLHEVGHAIGEQMTTGGMADPAFVTARDADKAKLDSYEGQAGQRGVEETYAESFARFFSKDPNDEKTYPHLHAYWASNPFVAKK